MSRLSHTALPRLDYLALSHRALPRSAGVPAWARTYSERRWSESVATSSRQLSTSAPPRAGLVSISRPRPTLAWCSSPLCFSARNATTLAQKPESPEEPAVFEGGDPSITLTERAANQLRKVSERENNPKLALRIAVEPGGCHGYQYKMELTEEVEEDDFLFVVGDGAQVLIDSISLMLVKGSTIDYVTELIGSQFAIKDNPQAKGAGCGCGVSWEPNI